MWIDELKQELVGRPLALWTGKNEDGSPLQMEEVKRLAYVNAFRERAGLERLNSLPRSCGCKGKIA